MREQLTSVRLQILFSILHMKEHKQNAASIAKELHISKSTVSRAIEKFQEQEIVCREELKLTRYGEEIVGEYWEKKERLKSWLLKSENMTEPVAEKEALTFLLTTREDTIEFMIQEASLKKGNHSLLDLDSFSEKCIDYLLMDGTYTITFTIYKHTTKHGLKLSMANAGFHHPGELTIKDGVGSVALVPKKIWQSIPFGKGLLSGSVDSVLYETGNKFQKAPFNGRCWILPTSFMKFTFNKGEGVLTGTAVLKLGCSAGKLYMPESRAYLVLSIHLSN